MSRLEKPGRVWLLVVPWDLDDTGGVGQVVQNLYREFCNSDNFEPAVLVNDWAATRVRLTNIGGYKIFRYRLPTPSFSGRGFRYLLSFIARLPLTLLRLQNFLRANGVEVANFHYPSLRGLWFVFLKRFGFYHGSLLLSFHGADLSHAAATRGIERYLWRLLLIHSDAVVGCSRALAEEITNQWPMVADKTFAVHNGLDSRRFFSGQDLKWTDPPLWTERSVILNIGTFEHKKGQDVLIQAFHQLAKTRDNLHLVLVGRAEPYVEFLYRQVRELGLCARIAFIEDVPHGQIGRLFQAAQVFVLPSRREPFGLVILEAALFELPVLASRVGGIPEIIEHNRTGVLVPPDDVNALAEELESLLKEPGRAKTLGAALRREALEKFGWDRACAAYERIVHSSDSNRQQGMRDVNGDPDDVSGR